MAAELGAGADELPASADADGCGGGCCCCCCSVDAAGPVGFGFGGGVAVGPVVGPGDTPVMDGRCEPCGTGAAATEAGVGATTICEMCDVSTETSTETISEMTGAGAAGAWGGGRTGSTEETLWAGGGGASVGLGSATMVGSDGGAADGFAGAATDGGRDEGPASVLVTVNEDGRDWDATLPVRGGLNDGVVGAWPSGPEAGGGCGADISSSVPECIAAPAAEDGG